VRECALHRVLRSLDLLHELTEVRRMILAEHVLAESGSKDVEACGSLDTWHAQVCVDNASGAAMALCDTDFVGPNMIVDVKNGTLLTRPLPFPTVVANISWSGFLHIGGRAPHAGLIDLACAFGNTVLRPLSRLLPPLAVLADELQARHAVIIRALDGRSGTEAAAQLSPTCMRAWVQAAMPPGLRAWARKHARSRGRTERPSERHAMAPPRQHSTTARTRTTDEPRSGR
jgi:hypothetical protein